MHEHTKNTLAHKKNLMKTNLLKLMLLPAFVLSDKPHIDRQLMSLVNNSSLRAFSGNIQTAIQNLDEYGCWCYFYDNVGRGKSQPVDEIDGFCKTLAEGYRIVWNFEKLAAGWRKKSPSKQVFTNFG